MTDHPSVQLKTALLQPHPASRMAGIQNRHIILFRHLIDSNGIIDEPVLDKLKLNIRSLIASQEEDCKDLLDLCIDVIYHNNMKAFGLQQLVRLYLNWIANPDHAMQKEACSNEND